MDLAEFWPRSGKLSMKHISNLSKYKKLRTILFLVYTETIQYEWEHYGSSVKAVLNRPTGHCIVSLLIIYICIMLQAVPCLLLEAVVLPCH
jgi:hypothetical protein